MKKELLTMAECNALRGLAIIGIFLHNYCHWLGPAVKENEYQYIQHHVDGLNYALLHADSMLPVHLLSFFGHYGVPVFLFLSAYGLVLKYEHPTVGNIQPAVSPRHREFSVIAFLRYHFLKLFKMMITGLVAFTMIDQITPDAHHYQLIDVVAQLLMLNNLLPNPDHVIWPGPYWFFGLMMQLYLVYRLLLYKKRTSITLLLILVCVAVQLFLIPDSEAINRYRYNFMGGMLPFGLGIILARYQHLLIAWRQHNNARQADGIVLLVSVVLTYACSLHPIGWALVPAFICTGSVAAIKLLSNVQIDTPPTVRQPLGGLLKQLVWMGSISAPLFACHPITRKIFIPISKNGDVYTGLLLYIVASICLAWLFKQLFDRIPSPHLK